MKSYAVLITLGAALLTAPAWAQKDRTDPPGAQFLIKAAQGGMAEVELGKLAEQKATRPSVKQFAEKMVQDHSAANTRLKRVADRMHLTLPTSPSAEDQSLRERLSRLSGREFDSQYMEAMVRDHQNDVAEFSKQANDADNPQVKAFASETLPTLREHLVMAEKAFHEVENPKSATR